MARGYRSGLVTGMVLSMVAAFLAPLWRPAATRYGRPAAKAAIKQGIVAFEFGRERIAGLGETVEDMLAEVQVELAAERMPAASPAPPADAA